MSIDLSEFEKPKNTIPYSKELLEEGKKYYGYLRFHKDGRVEELDWAGNVVDVIIEDNE